MKAGTLNIGGIPAVDMSRLTGNMMGLAGGTPKQLAVLHNWEHRKVPVSQ